jgi:flavin reductase (DIM6/NTAB) family NADH-FMN oxidoreductase RutF
VLLITAAHGPGRRFATVYSVRIDFDPSDAEPGATYRLLTSVVVPRPIAWVSTTSAHGVDNLAPHSFFTISCVHPPIVQFSSVGHKDTLRNVTDTGQFVVNFAGSALFEQINATATDFPAGISEFDAVGIEREASHRVRPPRVAESPVALECELHCTLPLGNSTVVFGQVVHVAVDSSTMQDGLPAIDRLQPLARLGKDEWSELGKVLEISRIRYQDWPGHFRDA